MKSNTRALPKTLSRLHGRDAANAGERDARDKGPKSQDRFEVWHHHVSLRHPGELALMLRLDERR